MWENKSKWKADRSASNTNNNNHNRFAIVEEDDEEDEESSEAWVSTSVVSDAINNRKKSKMKTQRRKRRIKRKWLGKLLVWRWKNQQNELLTNEAYQSVLSEHKSLEDHKVRVHAINDEIICFGIMHQCHLTLMINEKQVDWEKEVIEYK